MKEKTFYNEKFKNFVSEHKLEKKHIADLMGVSKSKVDGWLRNESALKNATGNSFKWHDDDIRLARKKQRRFRSMSKEDFEMFKEKVLNKIS